MRNGIEETLKNAIEEEFDLKVNSLQIMYDEKYENIETVALWIQNSNIAQIEKVEIGNQVQQEAPKNQNDYPEVRNYISENYKIDKNNININ